MYLAKHPYKGTSPLSQNSIHHSMEPAGICLYVKLQLLIGIFWDFLVPNSWEYGKISFFVRNLCEISTFGRELWSIREGTNQQSFYVHFFVNSIKPILNHWHRCPIRDFRIEFTGWALSSEVRLKSQSVKTTRIFWLDHRSYRKREFSIILV